MHAKRRLAQLKCCFGKLIRSVGIIMCLANTAFASVDYAPLTNLGTWTNNANVYMEDWQKHINTANAAASSQSATASAQTSTLVVPHDHSDVATKLAANYPPEQRSEAEKTFRDLLVNHHQIERQFNIPTYDLAGATAAFIAGSWMIYNDVDFPDAGFPVLAGQMRRVISTSPAFARASATDKSEMYDQLAIRGMYLFNARAALKKKPNKIASEKLRQVAAENLKDFFGVEPQQVHVGAQGLFIK